MESVDGTYCFDFKRAFAEAATGICHDSPNLGTAKTSFHSTKKVMAFFGAKIFPGSKSRAGL